MWQLCIMTILQNADAVCSGLEQSMLNQADAVHFRDVIFTPIREMLLSSKCTASQCSESGDRMQLAHCDNCMLWHHFSYEGLRKKPAYICYCSVCTLCIAVCWKLMSGGIDLHLDFNKQMKVTKRDTVGQWQCYVHFSRTVHFEKTMIAYLCCNELVISFRWQTMSYVLNAGAEVRVVVHMSGVCQHVGASVELQRPNRRKPRSTERAETATLLTSSRTHPGTVREEDERAVRCRGASS